MEGKDWLPILETIRWREGRVRILEQTLLPERELYLDLGSVDDVIDAVRRLAVRGAPAIGVAGALGVALAAAQAAAESSAIDGFMQQVDAEAKRLAAARPTAVNLRWGIERTLVSLERVRRDRPRASAKELAAEALAEGQRILEEDLDLSRAMAGHGFDLLPDDARVLTHCNTGGLATAGGGTALGVVLGAHARGKRVFVHVDETRPLLQGARLTAWELDRAKVPFAVHCDGAAAWLLKTERIHAVLVGADRIAANGDTANKIGTLSAALAAREFGVPFFVVAPRSSFDLSLASGEEIPIEERSPDEVVAFQGARAAPPAAGARNPAFDVTPARLIRGFVTERGVETPPFAP